MAWKAARLEEVAQVLGGGTPSRNEESYFGGSIAWATPTDITALDGLYISKTKETITDAGLQNSSTKLMPPGAVLLTSRATIGFTAVSQVPICTNQGFINFVCGPELVPEYLAYWLRTQKAKMIQHAGGTTFKEIARGAIKKFEIPIPPLPEQRRIVDLLSRAEGIVRLRREAEKKAAELIPALFLDMFGDPATNPKGWPLVKLADVCGKCATRDPKKHPDEEFTYIDIAAIDNAQGQVSETKAMLGIDAPSRARQVVQAGDVIVSTVRPNLRGSAWIPQHLDSQVCSTGFCVLRPSKKTTTGFIYAVIRSDWFASELMKHVRGAQYPAVSDKDVFGVQIPLPPLNAQQEFSRQLNAVRSIRSQQSAATIKAQATFDALLARAFSQ